jgi:hypothetical protein
LAERLSQALKDEAELKQAVSRLRRGDRLENSIQRDLDVRQGVERRQLEVN